MTDPSQPETLLDDVDSTLEALNQSFIPQLIDVLEDHRDWHDAHPNVVPQNASTPAYMLQKGKNVRRELARLHARLALARCDQPERLAYRAGVSTEEEGPPVCRVELFCSSCAAPGPDMIRHRRLEVVYFVIPDGWALWAAQTEGVLRASCPRCQDSLPWVPKRGPHREEMYLPLR